VNYEVLPGYSVVTPKKTFLPGETLELDEKEGKRLTDAGVVTAAGSSTGGSGNQTTLNVTETAKLVMAAETVEALDEFKDDARKGVQDALVKRMAELTKPAE